MKKKVIFLCLSILLFTCTVGFAATVNKRQVAQEIVNILCKDKAPGKQMNPIFSVAIYYSIKDSKLRPPYISDPKIVIDNILGKLPENLKQSLLDEEVFGHIAQSEITSLGATYEKEYLIDSLRREVVCSLVSTRDGEKKDFAEEIEFFGKCARVLRQQTQKKQDKSSDIKSKQLMTTKWGAILAEAKSSGYAHARAKALKILREEGNLDLANSVIFIENLKRELSYQAAAQELEKLANKADTLKSKCNFYSQAEEEYKNCNSQKSSAMRAKVEEVEREISDLTTEIGTAQQEADRLASEGKWSDAEQEIEKALSDFAKIGLQKISDVGIELYTKKSEYRTAIDLAKNIEKEEDIRKLDDLKKQIKAELTGHEKLEFLVLKRRYELKEKGLEERLTNLQNPSIWERASNFRKSQKEKDTEIEVLKKLREIAREEREGLKEEESEDQRKEREEEIRRRIINETAGILSNAKTDAAKIGKEAEKIAVERVALARIIHEMKEDAIHKVKRKMKKQI